MKIASALLIFAFAAQAQAKVFQNSYVSFEVPDTWNCVQEGVAWTCTPKGVIEGKEAVIVLAAKVAGPQDNLTNFQTFLAAPKKIPTKVGTPMPSAVMYAKPRALAGTNWIQAQHLGSEIQEYYTLYLATVKDQLAILVSFSAEKNRYQVYNPIFDHAIKTLKITANQQLLFPKNKAGNNSEVIGINVPVGGAAAGESMMPPPPERKGGKINLVMVAFGALLAAIAAFVYSFTRKRKKISHVKSRPGKTK